MSRSVTHDGSGTLAIRFPFDRALVELVKSLPNRRWNAGERFWSVPAGDVVPLVELLRGRGFVFDAATSALYRERGGTATIDIEGPRLHPGPTLFDADIDSPASRAGGEPDLTVSALNERVRGVMESAFPSPVWVVGEISGFNKGAHRRHVSFELVERGPDGSALSRVPAVLFAGARETIEAGLARAGGPFRLEDEVAVRVRVTVGLYVPWGQYRVAVEELDTAYTLGEAARRREEIVRRLAAEGLLGKNSRLAFPPLPLRVGLVTSLGSDAYNDVLRTLQESGYAFRLTVHGARVQGRSTERSVLNALAWLRTCADELDVVLICRGGGARTDLVWFDSERLGRAVASFPIPVVIGIGHEQDRSVLDEVGRSAKTPTAAAALLVEAVRESERRIGEIGRDVLDLARGYVDQERARARDRADRLVRATRQLLRFERKGLVERRRRAALGARRSLQSARDRLARLTATIPREARRRVESERQAIALALRALRQGPPRVLAREHERTDARERRVRLVDPRRVIERGYAILRDEHDRVLTEARAAPEGTRLHAELRRGAIRLRSEGPDTAG